MGWKLTKQVRRVAKSEKSKEDDCFYLFEGSGF